MNFEKEAKLKNNFMSLIKSLEKYGSDLARVTLGKDLWNYSNLNFYNTEFVNVYNKFGTPISFGSEVKDENYVMEFKVNKPQPLTPVGFVKTSEPGLTINPVGMKVTITEEGHQKVKKDLRKYLGKTGTCILHLKKQSQYIIEFEDGNVVAFPMHNVRIESNLSLVIDASVVETNVNGKEYGCLKLKAISSGDEIESYLRSNVGKVDAVTVTTRYFLAEI